MTTDSEEGMESSDGADSNGEAEGRIWYRSYPGIFMGSIFAVCTVVALAISAGQPNWVVRWFPIVFIEIPIEVYFFALLGSSIYTLLWISETWPLDEPGVDAPNGILSIKPHEFTFATARLLASLCLAAGIYLVATFIRVALPEVEGTPPAFLVAGIALVTGVFVDRAFAKLRRMGERLSNRDDPELIAGIAATPIDFDNDGFPWWAIIWSCLVIFASIGSILVVGLLTVNWGNNGFVIEALDQRLTVSGTGIMLQTLGGRLTLYPSPTTIPFDVYLYGFLGSMGYIYANLLPTFHRRYRVLCHYVFRVPVGSLLAAAFFLVGDYVLTGGEGTTPVAVAGLMACVSFIIGLYPEVAIARLDDVADALFGENPDENENGGGEDERNENGDGGGGEAGIGKE